MAYQVLWGYADKKPQFLGEKRLFHIQDNALKLGFIPLVQWVTFLTLFRRSNYGTTSSLTHPEPATPSLPPSRSDLEQSRHQAIQSVVPLDNFWLCRLNEILLCLFHGKGLTLDLQADPFGPKPRVRMAGKH